ncbi:hypothetical protein VNO77_00357 [Canavalia gladiata]|uniref:Uncharacterized protein n=1 Tax=Canavalia gladiata TaxID=3824 RepID=A0AAN9R585_CANGL
MQNKRAGDGWHIDAAASLSLWPIRVYVFIIFERSSLSCYSSDSASSSCLCIAAFSELKGLFSFGLQTKVFVFMYYIQIK